jgi:hypothetical protein
MALLICCSLGPPERTGGEEPSEVVRRAIKAHEGGGKIAESLTGRLVANATFTLSPEVEGKITWEESFELPRRYKRVIKGKIQGQPFGMEYAVTKGSGWIRRGNGPAEDFKGTELPLNRSWNAMLALLPPLLGDGVKLSAAGTEKVGREEAVGVRVSSPDEGEATLYFSRKTGLLVKSKRAIVHPLTGKEIDGEVVFGEYKDVGGVQYPHRVTSHGGQKKLIELEITKIEFLKSLDDRLFDKP